MQKNQSVSQLSAFCHSVLVAKSYDPSLFLDMAHLIADKVLLNFENNLSGSAVVSNIVLRVSKNHQ